MPHLTHSEERALAAVDAQATVTLLAELLAIPSISGSAAESDIQHVMAKKLDGLGLDVDLWPFDLDVLAGTSTWSPRATWARGGLVRSDPR